MQNMVMSYNTHFTGLQDEGKLLALHTNVRVGWTLLVLVNTLAYNAVLLLATLKNGTALQYSAITGPSSR
jgi:hypothetical protein